MSEYPDPDEEFELMYGDDLELLREQEYEEDEINILPAPKSRKSLDFNTPSKNDTNGHNKNLQQNKNTGIDSCFESGLRELRNDENDTQLGPVNLHNDIYDTDDINNLVSSQTEDSNLRKRSINDLFGDINDICEDELLSAPKKHKGDDKLKESFALIESIIEGRKLHKLSQNITTVTVNSTSITNIERDKRNMSYQVPKYPFIKVKVFNGQSVYVRCHSEEYEKDEIKRITSENNFRGVMGDNFKKIWSEAQELLYKETTEENSEPQDIEMLNQNDQEKQLWVELYKPRKYLELLSDECTNRTMLRWMKLWDKVVFNRNPKIKVVAAVDNNKKKFFNQFELNTKLDEFGRPEHKVALLCGPPGLGKTTLAHMVAKHAGYNVVEINASDDRSIDAFRTALENATQMRSVVDQEKRPNCIVFDEIDGAPQSSIEFLIKFISGSATTVNTKSKKTKNKPQNVLKRPIICICNDVYVPALRPLRQIAFVINFPQTSSARLAERLIEIARRQQIKTDLGAMMALSEKSNNDIRSCLSVLHFFKAQNKPIGLSDVYRASVGQKDMQKGLFTVWQEIFEVKRTKRPSGGSCVSNPKERMQNILDTISSFGDQERVAQGVYENFPLLNNVKDSTLDGTSCALDWFCFNDVIYKEIYASQSYSLSGFLNYAFVVWHFVFGGFQRQKLVYPSAGYEAKIKETRQKAIVAEVLRGMSPLVRCYTASLPLILDILPLIIRIITPSFRPVSLHLYTEEEKKNLLRVAGIMADYNLNYVQERRPDGVYEYNLEPNIEEIVTFDGTKDKRRQLSYSNKQLIAREVEMEKMRRFECQKTKKSNETKSNDLKKPVATSKEVSDKKSNTEDNVPLPNHLQTLKSKAFGTDKKVLKIVARKDFFGRPLESNPSSPGNTTVSAVLKNDIWYEYKEGFSNAVRKTILIANLK